MVDVEIV